MKKGLHRELFPILERVKYFNTCSMSALSLPVEKAINKFMKQWNNFAGLSWTQGDDSWNEIVEKARNKFAKLINAKPDNIAYSFGNSVAFSSVS